MLVSDQGVLSYEAGRWTNLTPALPEVMRQALTDMLISPIDSSLWLPGRNYLAKVTDLGLERAPVRSITRPERAGKVNPGVARPDE